MSRLERSKLAHKSTVKMPIASIAILGSDSSSQEKLKKALALGKEIARQGHIVCVSDINSCTRAVVDGANMHQGLTIGYIQSDTLLDLKYDNSSPFSHTVLPNTDYSNCIEMMLRAVSAVVLITDNEDALRPFTQPVPKSLLIGVLTDPTDTSHQITDAIKISEQSVDMIIVDSSPINLTRRILKRLRQQQLLSRS